MAILLHISDLHFGEPFVPPVAEALRRAANKLQPDLIVASGDFTQRARREQFQAARDYLNSLPPVPIVVTPGNHDVPAQPSLRGLFMPFALYQEYMRKELNYDMQTEELVLVSLNSTSALGSLLNGWISESQLDYCQRVFQKAPPEKLKIVVAHHHLAPAPTLNVDGGVMRKAKRAIELFTDLKIDLILGGHKHRAYIGNSLDFYAGKSRDHGIIIVQCGTSTSRRGRAREREKNTFNVIHTGADIIRVTQYMYFSEVNGFEVIGEHIFPRAQSKYVRQNVYIQSLGEKLAEKDVKILVGATGNGVSAPAQK